MTRKDFELIAEAVMVARDSPEVACPETIDRVAQSLAWALTDSNPNFDRTRFLAACGVEN